MQDADVIDDDADSAALAANSTNAQQQHSSSISSSSNTANLQQQSAVASLYSEDTEAPPSIDILLHHKPRYGFNNVFDGFFGGLREELIDMVQLPTPDTVMCDLPFHILPLLDTVRLYVDTVAMVYCAVGQVRLSRMSAQSVCHKQTDVMLKILCSYVYCAVVC
jgi:hypothetical protein